MPAVDKPQSLVEHLTELRRRIVYSLIALAVAVSICTYYADRMFTAIMKTANQYGVNVQLIQTSYSDAFMAEFKLVLIAGLLLASPVILYQVIAFILPALHSNERRILWIGLPSATLLFAAGWAFGWYIVVPLTIKFFLGVAANASLKTLMTPTGYIQFVLDLCNPLGLAFELPLLIFILARIGLVTARFLRRIWKISFMVILIIAAILSPPDVISLLMFFIPLYGLYELSIVVARFAEKKRDL